MAARHGNTARSVKTSMVEELLDLVSNEEYLEVIPVFGGTDYVNCVELSALKKMISGKLWVDSRKFLNRQNGMLSLFGQTVGKSAIDVKAEICDQLLDTDNKELHDKLRNSMKSVKQNYSDWISCLNQDNAGCDEFVLYLLCQTFKHHVVVILSSHLWSSFKPGTMSTFKQLKKADHVLVWLGEDKYGEVRPLHIKSGAGNVLEWQHLAEAIHHMHAKRINSKQQKRPDKSTTIKVHNKPDPRTVESTRQKQGKRKSSLNIDYKHYHSDRIRSAKSPLGDKPLPKASGPSTTRLAAQQMINDQKAIKKEVTSTTKNAVLVKPEPDIHMVYKKPKENVYWQYVHTDGRLCPKGASGVCRRKRSKRKPEDDMELPDLPESSPPAAQPVINRGITETLDTIDANMEAAIKTVLSGYIRQPRSVITDKMNPPGTSPDSPITLISPPAINCTTAMPRTPKHRSTKNLDDLLSTLNFDVDPAATQSTLTTKENPARSVVTYTSTITTTEQTADDIDIDLVNDDNLNIVMSQSVATIESDKSTHNTTRNEEQTNSTTTI